MNNASTSIFAKNWRIYRQILLENYMYHHDFSKQISSFLNSHSFNSDTHILDAGCGDAYLLSNLLKEKPIASFTGYDMSAQALKIAEKNLSSLKTNVSLIEGKMEESIIEEETIFDFIYSSFSIHHLSDSHKIELINNFFNHLKPGGVFIVIDILRNAELSREKYLEEYISHISNNWGSISNSDKELIYEHMRSFDFPAINTDFIKWIDEIGFNLIQRFDPDSRNMMLIAKKS